MKSIIKEQREKVESYIYLKNIEGCQAGSDICGLKNKKGEFICIHCERWNGQDRDVPAVSITPEELRDLHKQSLKQLIDGLVESLDGKREKDLSDKDIEDRLRVFTLTPSSEESIKEFVKVIGGISAKMGKNKAINDQISYLEKIRKQLE